MDKNVFRDLSYGMYVVTTKYKEKNVGCFVNTVTQITSENPIISVSVNKQNYTNEAIKFTKKFAVAILSEQSNPEVIGKFGFFSSKETDKFEPFNVIEVDDMPIINENICGYMICELYDTIDADTHEIFLGKVIDCKKINALTPMTYSYYHSCIKGKAPKSAPTYIEESHTSSNEFKKYRCVICGYVYDEEKEGIKFEDLPSDWHCPLCGVGKDCFELVK